MVKKLAFCGFIALLLSACDSKQVYDHYEDLPGYWAQDSTVSFQVEEMDTVTPYNLFINLRNNSKYPYSNLYLITAMTFPNGKQVVDTLQYEMANPDGTFMGNGSGELKENKFWYKEGVVFSEKGTYSIDIRQAMRKNGSVKGIDSLQGITEVGFRIEKIN